MLWSTKSTNADDEDLHLCCCCCCGGTPPWLLLGWCFNCLWMMLVLLVLHFLNSSKERCLNAFDFMHVNINVWWVVQPRHQCLPQWCDLVFPKYYLP
mmetsp:Transcript_18998/g.27834  ORF Transcript_18998/g.27834 Transcript_18998/m.27834 type:complete len:97 (+) Transcript_18998:166-456(+)